MRKSLESSSNVTPFPHQPRAAFPRRQLAPIPGELTCLVLIKHGETLKALKVSDCGIEAKAVWIPKAWLIIDVRSSEKFLVATLSKVVANHKRLLPRFIDHASGWSEDELKALAEAESLAARNRNRLRNYQPPMGWHSGRNVFA